MEAETLPAMDYLRQSDRIVMRGESPDQEFRQWIRRVLTGEIAPSEEILRTIGDESRAQIRKVAEDMEILDPRKEMGMLARQNELHKDLLTLIERQRNLWDVPRLEHLQIFPSPEVTKENVAFSKAYIADLEKQFPLGYNEKREWEQALKEARTFGKAWQKLSDAQNKTYNDVARRGFLKELQGMLPKKDFKGGQMPPHVPFWRFRVIK